MKLELIEEAGGKCANPGCANWITGNVTRPLELRYPLKGTPTVRYTVACNDFRYDEGSAKYGDRG